MENVVVSFGHGATGGAVYQPPCGNDHLPALVVEVGGSAGPAVYIRPDALFKGGVTDEHVRFARDLVEVAAQYRDELVRVFEHDQSIDDDRKVA